MMVRARLIHKSGKVLGYKSISEDCLAIKYGGSIFVSADAIIARAGSHPRPTDFYMTDTFHTDELEDAL